MELGNKSKEPQVFTIVCNSCGKKTEVPFEVWFEYDKHDVMEHFVCEECEKE